MHFMVNKHNLSLGFYFGFGNELKIRNYSFINHYYKLQLGYLIKNSKTFTDGLVVEAKLNFAKYLLTNP